MTDVQLITLELTEKNRLLSKKRGTEDGVYWLPPTDRKN
jgi:hypothetical protein